MDVCNPWNEIMRLETKNADNLVDQQGNLGSTPSLGKSGRSQRHNPPIAAATCPMLVPAKLPAQRHTAKQEERSVEPKPFANARPGDSERTICGSLRTVQVQSDARRVGFLGNLMPGFDEQWTKSAAFVFVVCSAFSNAFLLLRNSQAGLSQAGLEVYRRLEHKRTQYR